jgi:hypothetical protein
MLDQNNIALPSKPKIVFEEGFKGVYEIDGLYPGYGHTLGNSLRRIILSSLPGSSVIELKIKGIGHEFSTIEGVKEDVISIILNIKKIRASVFSDEPQTLKIKVSGPKEVTAKDIVAPSQVEIKNPELYLFTVTTKKEIEVEMTIKNGIGFKNWNGDDKTYFHSFAENLSGFSIPNVLDSDCFDYYIKHLIQDDLSFDEYTYSAKLSIENKIDLGGTYWALHFDANLMSNHLERIGLGRNINVIRGTIKKVHQNALGNVKSLSLDDGSLIDVDFLLTSILILCDAILKLGLSFDSL